MTDKKRFQITIYSRGSHPAVYLLWAIDLSEMKRKAETLAEMTKDFTSFSIDELDDNFSKIEEEYRRLTDEDSN